MGAKVRLIFYCLPRDIQKCPGVRKERGGWERNSNLRTERWTCTLPEPTGETDKLHSYFKDISATETRKAIPFQLYKEKKRQPASLAWPFVIF